MIRNCIIALQRVQDQANNDDQYDYDYEYEYKDEDDNDDEDEENDDDGEYNIFYLSWFSGFSTISLKNEYLHEIVTIVKDGNFLI